MGAKKRNRMEYINRFATAIGRHWKRLVLGATLAWLCAIIFFIGLFVVLEATHQKYKDYDLAMFQMAVLLFSFPAGALIAYGRRPRGVSQ
jgi:uncharacterized membrane protein (DUF4010 family)